MNDAQPEIASGRTAPAATNLLAYRVVAGIVRGVLLYFLVKAALNQYSVMPPVVFFPSFLGILYIAPVIEIAFGRLRISRLVLWAVLLAAIVAMLGFHDAWRAVEPSFAAHAPSPSGGAHFP